MEFIWEGRYVQVREMMRNPGLHGPRHSFSDLQGIRVLLRVDCVNDAAGSVDRIGNGFNIPYICG